MAMATARVRSQAMLHSASFFRRNVVFGCRPSDYISAVSFHRNASASSSKANGDEPALQSPKGNSFVNLGAFETMGGDAGRAATGIAYMEDALRLQEDAYAAEEDPTRRNRKALSLAQSVMQIGRQHHQQQDAEKALEFFERAKHLIEEFHEVHTPMRNLEMIQLAVSDNADAPRPTSKLQQAVEHATFMKSEVMCNIGVARHDLGKTDEALAAHKQAMQLRKEIVGKNNPTIAECLNNIGAAYFSKGAHQKAVEHYEQALDLLETAQQQESAYAAMTLYNIGISRARMAHFREAGVALKKALRIAEHALGQDHRQVELIKMTLQDLEQSRKAV